MLLLLLFQSVYLHFHYSFCVNPDHGIYEKCVGTDGKWKVESTDWGLGNVDVYGGIEVMRVMVLWYLILVGFYIFKRKHLKTHSLLWLKKVTLLIIVWEKKMSTIYIDGLLQARHNSSALAIELGLSYNNSSIYSVILSTYPTFHMLYSRLCRVLWWMSTSMACNRLPNTWHPPLWGFSDSWAGLWTYLEHWVNWKP